MIEALLAEPTDMPGELLPGMVRIHAPDGAWVDDLKVSHNREYAMGFVSALYSQGIIDNAEEMRLHEEIDRLCDESGVTRYGRN